MNFPILSAIIFIPLVGALFIFVTKGSQKNIENVTIFNVLGQQVLKMDSHSTIQNINMMSFQSGTYIIKVMIDNQTKIMKVIKE